jgi:hypothetical protein
MGATDWPNHYHHATGNDDRMIGNWVPRTYKYRADPMLTRVAAYKALRCLIYQCSEGDVTESDTFKELEVVAGEVAHAIVSALPAYETAAW